MFLQVNSIALEAWKEKDEKEPPVLLPRGGVFEVHKVFTTTKTPTGAEQKLYWIKFYEGQSFWLVAPQYWDVTELDERPVAPRQLPPKVTTANAMYRLVRVDDYGEEEKRKIPRDKMKDFINENS